MLKLRRGVVVDEEPLTVDVDGQRRAAWADRSLVGEIRLGDEVVVNVEALDLGLGSGGFDLIHVNLTRGLAGGGADRAHVMKLNYTSLQHPVVPVERPAAGARPNPLAAIPVLVIPVHGYLAPAAWAAAQAAGGLQVGYVQTGGGALPGSLSRDVARLRGRGLLCGQITAAPAYGGEREALGVVGALDAAAGLGWEAAIAGPGPGVIGSETAYGHGGMVALESAHAALALGLTTLLGPRLSGADPRPRHRGVSHHTRAVLSLLLAGVDVPAPAAYEAEMATLAELTGERHRLVGQAVDLDGYSTSGLASKVMGRGPQDDPIFFAAALASGTALARAARRDAPGEAQNELR